MKLPFQETQLGPQVSIRVFGANIDPTELVWHRDPETRIIEALSQTDWKVQLEGQLPQPLVGEITLQVGEWHRLIKGSGEVTVKITKLLDK
jgi:hypothetical protein